MEGSIKSTNSFQETFTSMAIMDQIYLSTVKPELLIIKI